MVRLRSITISDTNNIVIWRNKDFVRNNLYNRNLLTEEEHIRYYHKYIESGLVKQYIIEVEANELPPTPIGTVFFKNIDRDNKAEIGLFIGEETFVNRGYGEETLRLSLRLAFLELKLNKVYATIIETNSASKRVFEKTGFRVVGVLKENYLCNNEYLDVLMLEITKSMFCSLCD